MIRKLYKRLDSGALAYHEAWVNGSRVIEHWGEAGTRGESVRHRKWFFQSESTAINRVLRKAEAAGFKTIEQNEMPYLLVEYRVGSVSETTWLEKRYRLQALLDEVLGWTGLGHCDGGSAGSGTMEACCMVVEFDIAKRVVEEALIGTEFSDYSRIYCEPFD